MVALSVTISTAACFVVATCRARKTILSSLRIASSISSRKVSYGLIQSVSASLNPSTPSHSVSADSPGHQRHEHRMDVVADRLDHLLDALGTFDDGSSAEERSLADPVQHIIGALVLQRSLS